MRRLQKPHGGRGSALREGKSLVAIGGPTQTTITTGASSTLTFSIAEGGYGGKLCVQADGETDEIEVTSIKHNNDELISGFVPVKMFAHDSACSPLFGHYFAVNDNVTITLKNNDAASVKVLAAFNILQ